MNSEPTLVRIRQARQRISAKYGHDPEKLVEHYMELQKKYQDRLIPVDTPLSQRKAK
jgi:thymidylate kinase